MSRIMELIQMCKSLTPEDVKTLSRNRELLGELGKEFVPKHFLTCVACGTIRTDTDGLKYDDPVPQTCDTCITCHLCKQRRDITDRGKMCVNENCQGSPLWAKKHKEFGRRIDTFGLGFRA